MDSVNSLRRSASKVQGPLERALMRYGDHCAAAPSQQREQQVDLEGASSSHYSAADDVAREVREVPCDAAMAGGVCQQPGV